jgi:hypothetical protein
VTGKGSHSLLSGPDKIKDHEMSEAFRTNGRKEERTYNFGEKPEGQSPLGRPSRRTEYSIKIDFK